MLTSDTTTWQIRIKTHPQLAERRGELKKKKKDKKLKITLCQVSFTVSEMPVVHFSPPLVSNGEGTANQRLPSQAGSGLV